MILASLQITYIDTFFNNPLAQNRDRETSLIIIHSVTTVLQFVFILRY